MIHSDMALRDELSFLLQHSGFHVSGVIDGQEALAEIRQRPPALVIIAESRHRMDGDEPCVRVRELSQAPIIILGRSVEEAAGADFLEMGADAYLISPLNPRELLARVRSLLRCSQPNAAYSLGTEAQE